MMETDTDVLSEPKQLYCHPEVVNMDKSQQAEVSEQKDRKGQNSSLERELFIWGNIWEEQNRAA